MTAVFMRLNCRLPALSFGAAEQKRVRGVVSAILSTEACAMEINLGNAFVAPFCSDHILGPMMIWPPADGMTDSARSCPSAASAQASEEAGAAICLPDLSAENPFA